MINLSFIFYKYSFEKNFTKLFIGKDAITLNEFKGKLLEKFISKNNVYLKIDFDYEITSLDINQVITDPNQLILKNSYLSVKRIVNLNDESMLTYKPTLVQNLKDEESKLLNSILNEAMNQMETCKLCKKTGHTNKNCPVKGTALKPPSGIPKTKWLEIGPEKKIMTPVEYMAILNPKKEEMLFQEDYIIKEPIEKLSTNYPNEFKCPFGDHLIKDAVIMPCCGKFFSCNSCVLDKISKNETLECVNPECNQELGAYELIQSSDYLRNKITEHLNKMIPKPRNELNIKPKISNKENQISNSIFNKQKKINKRHFNSSDFSVDECLGIKKRRTQPLNENFIKKQKTNFNC